MISARPCTSLATAPVSTLRLPVVAPLDASDVYAIDVHGSDVTAPV